jgi:hypothetical protein
VDLTSWAWLIVPLGVTRAMQIALWDRITQRPRAWLLRKLNPDGLGMGDPNRPYLSYLLECPWCISVWIGLAAVLAVIVPATRTAALVILAALALSLVAVLLDRMIDRFLPDNPPAPASPPTVQGGVVAVWPEEAPQAVVDALADLTGDDSPREG